MKKVLIIAYYFPPLGWSGVQRTLKFVKYLRDFGWEPVVATVGKTKFSVLDESLLEDIPEGIEIIRIDDVKFKDITDEMKEKMRQYTNPSFDIISDENLKNEYEKQIEGIFEKLRSFVLLPDGNAVWANNVIKEISDKINLQDISVIYTTSSPYSTHIAGYFLRKKYNLPWVADFRDEWTNNPYISLDKNSLRFKMEKGIENSIVNVADKIITTTELAKENYLSIYSLDRKKVFTITNGYDEKDFINIQDKSGKEVFKVVHNGSFYSEIDPYTFIKAINNLINKRLINKSKIRITFVGKNDENINNNTFKIANTIESLLDIKGYISHKKSLNEASKANLYLLILGPNKKSEAVFPGKVFEYLRLKKPILALSPKGSVVEKLLNETGCGINVEYDDIKGIEDIILKFYNNWLNNKPFMVNEDEIKKYDRKILTKKLSKVFDCLVEENNYER